MDPTPDTAPDTHPDTDGTPAPDETGDRLRDLEDQVLDALGTLGADLGVNRAVAQIYALLYLNPDSLSLDDMADRLGVSKATVSVNVRSLERWGAVRRTWKEGSRRDWFTPNRDTLGVLWTVLNDGLRRRLELLEGPLEKARAGLEELDRRHRPEEGEEESSTLQRLDHTRRRLEEVQGMQARIRKLLSAPDWLRKLLLARGA